MTDHGITLHILLVEDDEENLDLLLETLPDSLGGYGLEWEPCSDFAEAMKRVATRRYDMIVTDIYRDRPGHKKGIEIEDEKAGDIISGIRSKRFCPIVAFTDGSAPQSFKEGPFVKLADKSRGNEDIVAKLQELLTTGIPGIARKLHDDLDRASGSYLWDFLEGNWERLHENGLAEPSVLERLVRRRAAMQIGRLDPVADDPAEVETVEGVEYYIHPPVSGELRLGEILRHKTDGSFRVVLTPHCHLAIQPGKKEPRAEYILTVKTVPAKELLKTYPPQGNSEDKKLKSLGRMMQSPVRDNRLQPEGRYWFLPGFLDMPDLYCDFLQLESIPYKDALDRHERFAVLDTPFAEAFQSCFTRFYSAVGLPGLDPARMKHLIEE